MGRPRSEYTCPKCGKQGYLENNPAKNNNSKSEPRSYRRVVHRDCNTGERKKCYVEEILRNRENEKYRHELEKKFSKMPRNELQQYMEDFIDKGPRNRKEKNQMRIEQEELEYVSIKRRIPLVRKVRVHKKRRAEVPPKELWGESSLYNEIKGLAEDYLQIYKYLDKISRSIYQFKPEKELSDRLAHSLSIFRKGFMDTQKTLLVPYSDKRWTADWIEWIGIHLSQLEQSKGYAGSKHAMETGEFAIWFKDGKETPVKLKRGITSKQIKNKEPELFKMVQQVIIGIPMIEALHQGTYQSGVLVDKTKRKI